MYDWNRKEMVPFASASNRKFYPVMTGASTASWVSALSLTGLSETLLDPKHGESKGFFFSLAQSRCLQDPTVGTQAFVAPSLHC